MNKPEGEFKDWPWLKIPSPVFIARGRRINKSGTHLVPCWTGSSGEVNAARMEDQIENNIAFYQAAYQTSRGVKA